MAEKERLSGVDGDAAPAGPSPRDVQVTAHSTSPGHVVFTEKENDDGWIATDTTVDCTR